MKVVMIMFNKLVVIEPINMLPSYKEKLSEYAKEVIFYDDIPTDDYKFKFMQRTLFISCCIPDELENEITKYCKFPLCKRQQKRHP